MRRKEFETNIKTGDASKLTVGIAISRYNEDITGGLLEGAKKILHDWKVAEKNIRIIETYGSFELPFACQRLIRKHKVDAVIALGCIVKGETRHDEFIANAVMQGLMRVMLESSVPVGLGILTTNTLAQAKKRSRGATNHGGKAALAVLDAALAVRGN